MSCCGSSCGTGGCCGRCGCCKTLSALVALLLTATSIATAIGVYVTHVTVDGWKFGMMDGSLAVVAFVVSIICWLKLVKKLCPCGKMGGGMCGACGHSPCTC